MDEYDFRESPPPEEITPDIFEEWLRTGPLPLKELQDRFGLNTWGDFDTMTAMRATRLKVISRFGFAIPSLEVVSRIAQAGKIIELGAGTGYWSKLIANAGGDILSSDANVGENYGFTIGSCFDVEKCEASEFVQKHPDRDVLIVWPTYNADWAFRAAQAMCYGRTLFLIGEGHGGCTANSDLFEYLEQAFETIEFVQIPVWPCSHDFLGIFTKKHR